MTVENLPYADLIARYDRPHTLFYVDPPYFGCEDYYGKGLFSRDDFTRLRDILAGIKGKFILSINDTPEIRDLFAQFHSVGGAAKQKKVVELLVMNYEPEK